ncbi:MAG TPA: NrfD/PsrC family molybdoenzyme membrane anchor subunit [Candidatus Acidoferrum sp.]|nr:NrfD/PsrC family molybdoenzyme membrane anchor subunit [Candidatus Acidoferrum sp.]
MKHVSESVEPVVIPKLPRELREKRLQELRLEAKSAAITQAQSRNELAPRATPETGYYGNALLKKPQWTKEIPLYFFCGGAAGAAAIIAAVAGKTGRHDSLARDARAVAAIGGAISPALLISDLGMPSRFLNMLRIFKVQSPMSVGSWTLVAFSSSSVAAAFLDLWRRQDASTIRTVWPLQTASQFLSAITGAVISTYTGVLLGATAIPVWNQNAGVLPIHFAVSGMAAASALLELRGHESPALNAIGIATSLGETAVGASIELRKNSALKPLKSGSSGWLTRIGGLLSGPVPLLFRLLALAGDEKRSRRYKKIAAVSSVAGSLATRFAWTKAGAPSAEDTALLLRNHS